MAGSHPQEGHPVICETFSRRQEAEDWDREIEHQIKIGQYKFGQQGIKQTFNQLIERYIGDGVLEWLQYFESHAIKVYSSGVNTVPKTALELLHRIRKRTIKEPFSARDVYHGHHWSGLSKV